MAGLFQRLQDQQRASVEIIVDGDKLAVLEGDTLLTAILTHRSHLRLNEIGDEPRAGFCLMGACQDCWLSDADGNRLRACTTYVRPGLEILTGAPPAAATKDMSAPDTAPFRDTTTAHATPAPDTATEKAAEEEGRS